MTNSETDIMHKLAMLEEQVLKGDAKEIEKQHRQGKLTARERLHKLLDKESFVEEFMLAVTPFSDFGMAEKRKPTDGVVSGYGKIGGRLVYVFAQDRTVMAGSVGSVHAEKISYVTDTACKLGVPVIGLHDSVYGLGAAMFTRDVKRGERIAAEELQAGSCFVNAFVKSDPRLPFGGIKQSGYGRELSSYGIREFVNVKTVYVK